MPILAIDVGNSRIKWSVHDGSSWTASGALDHGAIATLATEWANLPDSCSATGSNVAGLEIAARIETVLAANGIALRWIDSQPTQLGVRNLYDDPPQLGSDRWAALIAARWICPGPCLVVTAGTAVTVDALSMEGDFLGGLIMPGLRLMQEALVRDTYRLGCDHGSHEAFPRNTADAIASGAIEAIVGAVERMLLRLRDRSDSPVKVIASGGAIGVLRPYLPADVLLMDNLVLQGLLIIAGEG